MRNAEKAHLYALLSPSDMLAEAQKRADFTEMLAMTEEVKTLPFGAVWDYYCMKSNVGVGSEWLAKTKQYEADVLSAR